VPRWPVLRLITRWVLGGVTSLSFPGSRALNIGRVLSSGATAATRSASSWFWRCRIATSFAGVEKCVDGGDAVPYRIEQGLVCAGLGGGGRLVKLAGASRIQPRRGVAVMPSVECSGKSAWVILKPGYASRVWVMWFWENRSTSCVMRFGTRSEVGWMFWACTSWIMWRE
jgi:hypothetical protein